MVQPIDTTSPTPSAEAASCLRSALTNLAASDTEGCHVGFWYIVEALRLVVPLVVGELATDAAVTGRGGALQRRILARRLLAELEAHDRDTSEIIELLEEDGSADALASTRAGAAAGPPAFATAAADPRPARRDHGAPAGAGGAARDLPRRQRRAVRPSSRSRAAARPWRCDRPPRQ
jgi:hypothetical protein